MEVIWSRPAKETLAAILEYIENNFDSAVAFKVYCKINDHVDSLAFFPKIGVKVPHLSANEVEVRYLVNTPNIIHYAIIRNIIVVISVFDTRRSPETISVFVKDFLEHYK